MKKVLGIDPGFGRLGWAILEGNKSSQKVVSTGCLETSSKEDLSKRLSEIFDFISDTVDKYGPDEAAIEELYYFKNAKTVIGVGQAMGAVIVALEGKGIRNFRYTPLQVKSTVAGYGRADKKQVQDMTKRLLKLNEIPKPDDAADACAVALTHFFMNEGLITDQ
ncbi:crossover junction endodeoxyribonuclease RuvC [Candidatus Woesebacteria bacterium]|nr:crossover junction endodeoxyribonuclease RuvC [Candidatus Woesebacteria bacterium]